MPVNAVNVYLHGGVPWWLTVLGWIATGVVTGGLALAGVLFVQRRADRTRDHDRRSEVYTEFLQKFLPIRAFAEILSEGGMDDEDDMDQRIREAQRTLMEWSTFEEAVHRCMELTSSMETASLDPELAEGARTLLQVASPLWDCVSNYRNSDRYTVSAVVRSVESTLGCLRLCTGEMRRELGLPFRASPRQRPWDRSVWLDRWRARRARRKTVRELTKEPMPQRADDYSPADAEVTS